MDDTLARAGIFQGVEPQVASALATELERVTFSRSAVIFSEGELGAPPYIILDGKVKLGWHTPGGRQRLLAVMGPGDIFGELSFFDPGPRTVNAIVVTDIKVATIERMAMHSWLLRWPEIAEQLLRIIARRLRHTNEAHADLILTDVPRRVAKTLLQLARQFGTRAHGSAGHPRPDARRAGPACRCITRNRQ